MKPALLLLLTVFSLAQTQSSLPTGGGLVIENVNFQEKMLKTPAIPASMVSHDPPVLSPDPRLEASKVRGVSHKGTPRKEPPDPKRLFYVFTAQMRNDSSKIITRVVWAYRVSHHPHMADIADTEFLCSTKIEPGRGLEIKSTSRIPNVKVVDVSSQGSIIDVPKPTIKDFVIKRVQFSDGTSWQQPDWDSVILTRRSALNLKKGKCITL